MSKPLASSDIKHLCRLLGWVECEIGPEVAGFAQGICVLDAADLLASNPQEGD